MYLCMYVCMVVTYSRVWINRVRLPILLVVSWTGKMNISLSAFAPENSGLARRVRQSRLASACSSPHSGWIWCLLSGFLPGSAAASMFIYFKPPYAIGSVPSLSGHAIAYRWRSLPRVHRHKASKPRGSSDRLLPWQITMDQLICASLSHTHHYWLVISGHVESTGEIHDGYILLIAVLYY